MAIIQGTSKASSGSYQIDQSIRFNDDDSAYLSRTFGTPTDATNWTFSAWVKRCNLGTEQWFFNSGASAAAYYIRFESTDKIRFRASTSWDITTTQVFRDVSAWYHIVATFENGAVTLYVNNESIATASVADTTYNFFTNIIHSIGGSTTGASNCDLYLANTHGIDGQALAPTDFGETNDDGVWVPKAYEGTYGTNGFYITGEDSAALGTDYSGNGNNFTSSGLTAADQMLDTPTDNYFTFNKLACSTNITLSDGNLKATCNSNVANNQCTGTVAASAGKISLEYTIGASNRWFVGATAETGYGPSQFTAGATGLSDTTAFYYSYDGSAKYGGSSLAGSWATFTTNDVINIDIDLDNLTIDVRKNNVSTGSTVSIIAGAYTALISFGTVRRFMSMLGRPHSPTPSHRLQSPVHREPPCANHPPR
jgi:hypothetical protein